MGSNNRRATQRHPIEKQTITETRPSPPHSKGNEDRVPASRPPVPRNIAACEHKRVHAYELEEEDFTKPISYSNQGQHL
ncbi:hypothetical protein AOLI_G00295420 [Acnodon oligacanthus]